MEIENFRKLCVAGKILWTSHGLESMLFAEQMKIFCI